MNLQGLGKVETYQKYLDMAFLNGIKAAEQARNDTMSKNRQIKSKRIETARLEAMGKTLMNTFDFIVKCFPCIDHLAPFYQELIFCTLEIDTLKQSLGALTWAKGQITGILHKYTKEITQSSLPEINDKRRAFSGRISSILKQIKPNLEYLEYARTVMKSYPSLKTKVNTIVIAGAPNVGKSTLLARLTGSAPKTAPYPFTTTKLNLGYDAEENQYIDTPGLLDRELDKRNKVEKQAILALKHLATVIVFVIDPTENCGYPISEQRNLLAQIKHIFTQPVLVVSNKIDTGKSFKNSIEVSAMTGEGIQKLQQEIKKAMSQNAIQLQQNIRKLISQRTTQEKHQE